MWSWRGWGVGGRGMCMTVLPFASDSVDVKTPAGTLASTCLCHSVCWMFIKVFFLFFLTVKYVFLARHKVLPGASTPVALFVRWTRIRSRLIEKTHTLLARNFHDSHSMPEDKTPNSHVTCACSTGAQIMTIAKIIIVWYYMHFFNEIFSYSLSLFLVCVSERAGVIPSNTYVILHIFSCYDISFTLSLFLPIS